MVAIGDVDEQGSDDLLVFRGRGEVDRLLQVVGRRVIALGQPVFEELLLFGRVGLGSNAHDQRGHSVTDEVVLVAANEKIAHRLGVGLNLHAVRTARSRGAIAKIESSRPKTVRNFSGYDRQEHVDIDVGDDGRGRDRGISGEVAWSPAALFPRR